MKYYCEILTESGDPMTGSDAVCILDGRMTLENMLYAALLHRDSVQFIKPEAKHYRIRQGERFNDRNRIVFDSTGRYGR